MVDGGRTAFRAAEAASVQEVHVVTAEDVFVGVDMGKDAHYAQAITTGGVEVFDRPVPNDETEIRTLIEDAAEYGLRC